MKLIAGTGYGAIGCSIAVSKDLLVTSEVPCGGLGEDAIGYAVCRFLKKSGQTAERYVRESYRLRLATGKAGKCRFCWLSGPARALALPGAWVGLRRCVRPEGATVERLQLYARKRSVGNGWRAIRD